ncbi:hypothetical protein BU17DRAFT_36268, partial [Hysterangium stoloniferum]
EPAEIRQVFYGQLQYILDFKLPRSQELNVQHACRTLLACVKPCITNGKDATIEVTSYKRMSTVIYIDLQTIECVVG